MPNYTLWATNVQTPVLQQCCEMTQVSGVLDINGLVALAVMKCLQDFGPKSYVEVRNSLGVVLWTIQLGV